MQRNIVPRKRPKMKACECTPEEEPATTGEIFTTKDTKETQRKSFLKSFVVLRVLCGYAFRSALETGSSRMRLPVAAKIALHKAGANGGTPGSPTPAGGAVLSTM